MNGQLVVGVLLDALRADGLRVEDHPVVLDTDAAEIGEDLGEPFEARSSP